MSAELDAFLFVLFVVVVLLAGVFLFPVVVWLFQGLGWNIHHWYTWWGAPL